MTGAQFEIRVDGTPRSYRDRKDFAMVAARFIKSKNPHSMVEVKDLQSPPADSSRFGPRRHSTHPRERPVDRSGLAGHLRGMATSRRHSTKLAGHKWTAATRVQSRSRARQVSQRASTIAHGYGRAAASSDERHPTSRWSRRTLGFDRVERAS
jgi:hypothetical protein